MEELALLLKIEKLETTKSHSNLAILEELSKLVYFSYFCIDNEYYLFMFAKTLLFKDLIMYFILSSNFLIKENIISNHRRFRSLRGFCLYITILRKGAKKFVVFETNLSNDFWERLEFILQQKNKYKLDEFLFSTNSFENKRAETFSVKSAKYPIKTKIKLDKNRLIFYRVNESNYFN